MVAYNKKQYDEAIDWLTKAIQLSPNEAEFYENLGLVYYITKDINKAVELFEKGYQLDPKRISLLERFAHSLNLAKDFQAAYKVIKEIQAIEPNNKFSMSVLIETMKYINIDKYSHQYEQDLIQCLNTTHSGLDLSLIHI